MSDIDYFSHIKPPEPPPEELPPEHGGIFGALPREPSQALPPPERVPERAPERTPEPAPPPDEIDYFAHIKPYEQAYKGPFVRAGEGFAGGYHPPIATGIAQMAEKYPTAARVGRALMGDVQTPWGTVTVPTLQGAVDKAIGAIGALPNTIAGVGAGMVERDPNSFLPMPRVELPRALGSVPLTGLTPTEASRLQRDISIGVTGAMTEPVMGLAAARPLPEQQMAARGARRIPEPPTPEEEFEFYRREQASRPPPPPPRPPPPSGPDIPPGQRGPGWRATMDDFARWQDAQNAGQATPGWTFWDPPRAGDGLGEIRPETGGFGVYQNGARRAGFATPEDAAAFMQAAGYNEIKVQQGSGPGAGPRAGPEPPPGAGPEPPPGGPRPGAGPEPPPEPPPEAGEFAGAKPKTETWEPSGAAQFMGYKSGEIRTEGYDQFAVYLNDAKSGIFKTRDEAAAFLRAHGFGERGTGPGPGAGPKPGPEPGPRPGPEPPPPPPPPPPGGGAGGFGFTSSAAAAGFKPPPPRPGPAPRAAPEPPPRAPEPPPRPEPVSPINAWDRNRLGEISGETVIGAGPNMWGRLRHDGREIPLNGGAGVLFDNGGNTWDPRLFSHVKMGRTTNNEWVPVKEPRGEPSAAPPPPRGEVDYFDHIKPESDVAKSTGIPGAGAEAAPAGRPGAGPGIEAAAPEPSQGEARPGAAQQIPDQEVPPEAVTPEAARPDVDSRTRLQAAIDTLAARTDIHPVKKGRMLARMQRRLEAMGPEPSRPEVKIDREAEVSRREAEMLRAARARPEPPPEPPRAPIAPEQYSVRNMLDPKENKAFGDLLTRPREKRTPQQAEVADLLIRAETRSLELSKLINDAGFKVSQVNSFNAQHLPEVIEARRELSRIGGSVSRVLAGLRPRKGRDQAARERADIEQLRDVLGVRQEAPQAAPPKPHPLDVPEADTATVYRYEAAAKKTKAGSEHVDLGQLKLEPNIPLGKQAQDAIVARGRASGVENLIAFDKDGNVLANGHGLRNRTGVSAPLEVAIVDPKQSISFHHTHPRSTTFSGSDIASLALPGMHSIWAHGHDGTASRANLTPAARKALPRTTKSFTKLQQIASDVQFLAYDVVQKFVDQGMLRQGRDAAVISHIISTTFDRAGVIDYKTGFKLPPDAAKLNLDPYIKLISEYIAEGVFNDKTKAGGGRRPQPIRHPGDLGAVFDLRQEPRQGRTRAPSDIELGPEDYRVQEEPYKPGAPGIRLEETGRESRGAFARRQIAARKRWDQQLTDSYKRGFDPGRLSNSSLLAEPMFRARNSAIAQASDQLHREGERRQRRWNWVPEATRLRFLNDIERAMPVEPRFAGTGPRRAPRLKPLRGVEGVYRGLLDEAHQMEMVWGSRAGYIEDYFPHIWERPDDYRIWAENTHGPDWFQKPRTFDYIADGIAAGFKLKSSNPEEMIRHRLMSGADMRFTSKLLDDLRTINQATPERDVSRFTLQVQNAGWERIKAPNGEHWLISPDVWPIWENAVKAKGMWGRQDWVGKSFRGWMGFKNIWVPIRLAFSAFHMLHVAHIHFNSHFASALDKVADAGKNLVKLRPIKAAGDIVGAVGSVARGISPIQPSGIRGRRAWLQPEGLRSQYGQEAVDLMIEGGFSPMLSEQLRIDAGEKLSNALSSMNPFRIAVSVPYHGIRRAIQGLQSWLFEHWIPHLKTAAYLNDVAAHLRREPWLQNDPVKRGVALSAIAKSIDNRFGEMFYSNLFWDRTTKDLGIGSFLSLGWNLGFVREFGGAAAELVARPIGGVKRIAGKQDEARGIIRDATNKIKFVGSYLFTGGVIGLIISAIFGDKEVKDLTIDDTLFPLAGGKNPDGSDRRFNTMFYNRELPMVKKHIEEHGGGVSGTVLGLGATLWNKLLFQPFLELARNKSYWGQEIWDPDAEAATKIDQVMRHILGQQMWPMTVTGAERAKETGGTETDVTMAYLGFGPAPAYAAKTRTQNEIAHYFQTYVSPGKRPYEDPEINKERQTARNRLLIAKQKGDRAAVAAATKEALAAGLKPDYIKRLGNVSSSQTMFKRLNDKHQTKILEDAPEEERPLYLPHAHKTVKEAWRKTHPGAKFQSGGTVIPRAALDPTPLAQQQPWRQRWGDERDERLAWQYFRGNDDSEHYRTPMTRVPVPNVQIPPPWKDPYGLREEYQRYQANPERYPVYQQGGLAYEDGLPPGQDYETKIEQMQAAIARRKQAEGLPPGPTPSPPPEYINVLERALRRRKEQERATGGLVNNVDSRKDHKRGGLV